MEVSPKRRLHPATLAIHAGQKPDPSTGAIMTPIYQTSTYVQESPGVHKGYEYSRSQNPTREALEKNLAALEGADYGLCFSSGCAAMNAVILSYQAGDHFIVCDDVYGGTYRLFDNVLSNCGFLFDFVDLTDTEKLLEKIRKETKLIWLETPTNPLLKILDIQRISQMAHERGLHVLVDNTFLSPIFQKPLELGADMVLHSTTKYIGGHSDVVGGFVGTSQSKLAEKLRFNQNSIGSVPGPMDCFLNLRGTKTLELRMKRHCENAQAIAHYLEQHTEVERVIYPGLQSHPQYQLGEQQMKQPGGMLSFVLKGGLKKARRVLEHTQIFACAESLGGVESLIEHPAIMTHASIPKEKREALGIHDGLIRLSVGIEYIDDLIWDLEQALKA